MQDIIEVVRRLVVMVLIMELVIQLSPAKQYEPYMKMLIGALVIWHLTTGICGLFGLSFTDSDILEEGQRIYQKIESMQEQENIITEGSEIKRENNVIGNIYIEKIPEIYVEKMDP